MKNASICSQKLILWPDNTFQHRTHKYIPMYFLLLFLLKRGSTIWYSTEYVWKRTEYIFFINNIYICRCFYELNVRFLANFIHVDLSDKLLQLSPAVHLGRSSHGCVNENKKLRIHTQPILYDTCGVIWWFMNLPQLNWICLFLHLKLIDKS